jgi:hypothetical protein
VFTAIVEADVFGRATFAILALFYRILQNLPIGLYL